MALAQSALNAAQLIERLDRLACLGEAGSALNPAQWEALRYVADANRFSRTPVGLSVYLGKSGSTVAETLASLEQTGHITWQPGAHEDRLELTPEGERVLLEDPVLGLAADLAVADTETLDTVAATLRSALAAAIERNGGRAFGACYTCRHFLRGAGTTEQQPHHCGLLDEPLSERDSKAICMEQVPAGSRQ